MSAKNNFCPVGEELESRSLLNVSTPLFSAVMHMESLHEAEHRAMVHQRVHTRTFPKSSTQNPINPTTTTPTFTWQAPADLPQTSSAKVHPHTVHVQTNTNSAHVMVVPVQVHWHGH